MFSGEPKFTVGPAPHKRSGSSITRMNIVFILALMPALIAGAIVHSFGHNGVSPNVAISPIPQFSRIFLVEMGLNSGAIWLLGIFGMIAFGMGLGVLTEYLCQVAMRQPYRATDGHGALMGLLVVALMPPTAPIWLVFIGVVVTIFIGKQIFGGLGGYPMHPAMVGWLILLLSWPRLLYPMGSASIIAPHMSAVIAAAAGGIVLWLMGYIRIQIWAGVLLGVLVFSLIFQARLDGGLADQFLVGHVVLAAFFIATDSTCSPANRTAMWGFGIGVGFLIVLIRAFGGWSDAIPFAILLMNAVHPLLDRIRPNVREVVVT